MKFIYFTPLDKPVHDAKHIICALTQIL